MFVLSPLFEQNFGKNITITVNKNTIYDGQKSSFRKIATIYYEPTNIISSQQAKLFYSDIVSVCHILNRKYMIRYPITLYAVYDNNKIYLYDFFCRRFTDIKEREKILKEATKGLRNVIFKQSLRDK